MRIALFTYFASYSYGATLQTYATIKILREMGHDVCLVNYIIPEPPRSLLVNCLLFFKKIKLKRFRERYFDKMLTAPYKTYDELRKNPPQADAYMIGSDQTWNPDISREKAKGFFLGFGTVDVRRITYATSFGKDKWDDTKWINKSDVNKYLHRFDKILIREKSGQELLKNEFKIESEMVVDPVFLFTGYPELTGYIKETDEITTFKLVDSKVFYHKMKLLSDYMNIPVRILGSLRRKRGFVCCYPEGIERWLYKLASSRYVVTDSFHGVVVSIIYHRPFLVFMGDPERFARLRDLLLMFGLEDRIVSESDDVVIMENVMKKQINWSSVDKILQKKREESLQLLKEELQ